MDFIRFFGAAIVCATLMTAATATANTPAQQTAQQDAAPVKPAPQSAPPPVRQRPPLNMLDTITRPQDMELIAVGTVAAIPAADSLRLEGDDFIYVLANVRVPVLLDTHAVKFMQKLLVGKTVGIYVAKRADGNYSDNFGRITAHVLTDDAIWVQAELVARGLAYADSVKEDASPGLALGLYPYEELARRNRAGLWANKELTLKTSVNVHDFLETYQVYEGVVENASFLPDKNFVIVFNKTPREDLRLFIAPEDFHAVQTGLAPLLRMTANEHNLSGIKLRVRGWVENRDGPAMQITHPQQIEAIDHMPHF